MAPRPDPVAMLLSLADCAARGRPVAGPVASWLTAGVRTYLTEGGALDAALGLRKAGWSAALELRRRERNGALRRACALLGNDAAALALEVRRFEVRTWPRWRSLGATPESASEIQRELFSAFAAGLSVPSSARHLARICGR